jgi:hypothetical protein
MVLKDIKIYVYKTFILPFKNKWYLYIVNKFTEGKFFKIF